MTANQSPRAIKAIVAFILLMALAVGFDASIFIRGAMDWRWSYDVAPAGRIIVLSALTLVYIIVALWLLRRPAIRPVLLWAFLGTAILAYAAVYVRDGDDLVYSMFTMTASEIINGTHHAGATIDWSGGQWRDWPLYLRTEATVHTSRSGPLLPIWYGLMTDIMGELPSVSEPIADTFRSYQCHYPEFVDYTPAAWSSAWFGMLKPVWAALTVFPLYYLAVRVVGSVYARQTAIWWASLPVLGMFAGSWNTFYPVMTVLVMLTLIHGLDQVGRSSYLWVIVSGLFMGVALLANFSVLPLLSVLGFYTLGHYIFVERRTASAPAWYRPVIVGVWFGVGMLLPWLFFWVVSGSSPVSILEAALEPHFDLEYNYLYWVFQHVWDWMMFSGVGFFLLLVAAVLRGWRDQDNPPLLATALLLSILILTISGTSRGESGRVWAFLSPLLLVAAMDGVIRLGKHRPGVINASWRELTVVQGVALVITASTIITTLPMPRSPVAPTPSAGMIANPPAQSVLFTDDESDSFSLQGWNATQTDNGLQLDLIWQPLATMRTNYRFEAVLIDASSAVISSREWHPGRYLTLYEDNGDVHPRAIYPTTCWQPDTLIYDTVLLDTPGDMGEGWRVHLRVQGLAQSITLPIPIKPEAT